MMYMKYFIPSAKLFGPNMSRKVPGKIGQCLKAMLDGFYGKARYLRSLLLNVMLLKSPSRSFSVHYIAYLYVTYLQQKQNGQK